jgi:hypothetical protein
MRLLSDGELLQIVEGAYHNARAAAIVARSPSGSIYMRSRRFIAELASASRIPGALLHFVPHPRTWGDCVDPVNPWRWSASAWAICRSA